MKSIPAHTDLVGQQKLVVWSKGFEPADFQRAIVEAFTLRTELLAHAATAPTAVRGHYEWHVQAAALGRYLRRKDGARDVANAYPSKKCAEADA